jgi:putative transposase
MKPIVYALFAFVTTLFRSQLSMRFEIIALRHQLSVYQRTAYRPRINPGDRVLWSWLSRRWSGWRNALVIVQAGTVIAWQRKRFRDHWAKLSKQGRPGRPPVSKEWAIHFRSRSATLWAWNGRAFIPPVA